MQRIFNITGCCNPQQHYMVNLDSRLAEIKKMIDRGDYFTINRGRQYGKTTTLKQLKKALSDNYIVISLDFQKQMSNIKFLNEENFSVAFGEAFLETLEFSKWKKVYEDNKDAFSGVSDLVDLFKRISRICRKTDKPIVLIIDEIDRASNNQVFLDFLAQLRGYYLDREDYPIFQSVILAGVHDIRHLKQKIRPEDEHKLNSPWNIAAEFKVDMSFSTEDIAGMLTDYENDHHTGMSIQEISKLIFDYTSGYPVLVSTLCKYMDEKNEWTGEGLINAVKVITIQKTPLFESLIQKLTGDEKLRRLIYKIVFYGFSMPYNLLNDIVGTAAMYGFIRNDNGSLAIANRIFETIIYDWFITLEATDSPIFDAGSGDKSQFIQNGRLDMDRILEKFVMHFNDIYGSQPDKFKEDDGRKLFLLYLRPIINGTGNYYIEAQTRDHKRTDVVVDYLGKQYVIELKIWHGNEYNSRGEKQLSDYLDYFHISKGYMVSFNFNKKKEVGVKKIQVGEKSLVEAVV